MIEMINKEYEVEIYFVGCGKHIFYDHNSKEKHMKDRLTEFDFLNKLFFETTCSKNKYFILD